MESIFLGSIFYFIYKYILNKMKQLYQFILEKLQNVDKEKNRKNNF